MEETEMDTTGHLNHWIEINDRFQSAQPPCLAQPASTTDDRHGIDEDRIPNKVQNSVIF